MPVRTCEFCGKAAVFVIRQMEGAEPRAHHVCARHASNLDLPPGTYAFENPASAQFADLAAAVALAPAAHRPRRPGHGAPDEQSLTASG